jgi:toxin ParE1/3/4
MRVVIAPLAEQDLESVADYIARDNPVRAITFVRELRGQCERIGLNPLGYRQRQELGDGIRSCAHGNYVIYFEIEPDTLRVVRILHGARDLSGQFGQNLGKDS